MAIGHSGGAFASVEAPKVDFGEIALNAQKFNEADIERQEAKKAAEAKAKAEAKEFDWKVPGSEKSSGVVSYEASQLEMLNDAKNRITDIAKEADMLGGQSYLPTETKIEYQNLMLLGKQIDANKEVVFKNIDNYTKNINSYSKASDSQMAVISAMVSGKVNTIMGKDGRAIYKVQELNEDGSVVTDGNGNAIYKTFVDKFGNEKNYVTNEDFEGGGVFDMVKAFDLQDFSNKVAKHISPYAKGTDTGVTAVKDMTLTDQNKQSISILIDSELSNRDSLIDVLYKLNPEVYGKPKKEYSKEDKDFAKAGLEKAILGGIPLSSVTTVDNAERNRQREEDKYKATNARVPYEVKIGKKGTLGAYVSPDVKKDGGLLVINGAMPSKTNIDATDLDGNRVNIPYGSILTSVTKGVNGGSLARVTTFKYKSAKDATNAKDAFAGLRKDASIEEIEAIARTYGASTESDWYRVPGAGINMLLSNNKSGINNYVEDVVPKVTVKNWKKPTGKKTNKVESR